VAPEFQLANFKSIPLRKKVYKIRDEDVDKAINHLLERRAELVPVEDRAAETGDIVTMNVQGAFTDDQAASTESAEGEPATDEVLNRQDAEIELGGRGVLKEFTEALTGTKPGDSRTFPVEYPADYDVDKFKGRKVNLTVEVTALRKKELPELNDEFATTVGEGFKSVEELRAHMRSNFEQEAQRRTEGELRSAAMDQLVERNRFEVPEFIVEKQVDSRLRAFISQLAQQGIDPRQLKFDWQAAREEQRGRAEREVRGSFILDRVAEVEKIEVGDDEVDSEVEKLASGTGQTIEAVMARLTKENALDSIREQIRSRKALDLVISSAEIRTEEIDGLGAEEAASGGEG
jgi:trigger factor